MIPSVFVFKRKMILNYFDIVAMFVKKNVFAGTSLDVCGHFE